MRSTVTLPNFDKLLALHQNDPDAFNAYRKHLLKEVVDQAPAAQRPALEELLARIEAAHAAAATPMEAAISAFHMMQHSVNQLRNVWGQAQYKFAGLQTAVLIENFRR